MQSGPIVPSPSSKNKEDASWLNTMEKLAARYNDAQICLDKLNNLLAEGRHTPNQMRRAEEDCVRTFGLFITALIESYSYDR